MPSRKKRALVLDQRNWVYCYSDEAEMNVRHELVKGKAEALQEQGLSWDQAHKLANDPSTYSYATDGVEHAYARHRYWLPPMQRDTVWTLQYFLDRAISLGEKAATAFEQENGTAAVTYAPTDEQTNAAFDALWQENYKEEEHAFDNVSYHVLVNDRVAGRLLFSTGFRAGWQQWYRRCQAIAWHTPEVFKPSDPVPASAS